MYDAIIVGARCAGSSAAMLLARKGYRVLLVDRATFPSDTTSTHILWQRGGAMLKHWGLLDRLVATGCPGMDRARFTVGSVVLDGAPPSVDDVEHIYGPRRTMLDKLLVDAAVEAGAELREAFMLDDVTFDSDSVTGIRGHARSATSVTERARIVIGADGIHSRVAAAVSAPEYNVQPARTFYYYSYWSGVPFDRWEGIDLGENIAGAFATHNGLTTAFVGGHIEEFHRFRSDIESTFFDVLRDTDFAPRLRSGRREEPFYGTCDTPNFYRKPYGPGWALAGDAGYNKDPITAQGISDALTSAESLAAAIDEGLGGGRPIGDALAGYEQQRNAQTGPMYALTTTFARLQFDEQRARLIAALVGNQAMINGFFGTFTGATSIPEFYSPDNVAAIMQGAVAAR